MRGDLRATALALRDAASDPETDLCLICLFVETAFTLEDAAEADQSEIFLPGWQARRPVP